MAKNKNGLLGLICKIVTLVLCALTVVSFFLPVFSGNKDYKFYSEHSKVSSCNLVFISAEKAEEKYKEITKDYMAGEISEDEAEAKAGKYSLVANLKDEEFEHKTLVSAMAWLHFVAAVLALGTLVIVALSFLGIRLDKFAKFIVAGATLFVAIALVLGAVFLGKDTGFDGEYGDYYVLGFGGVILGLISTAIATVASFLSSPCKKTKKN